MAKPRWRHGFTDIPPDSAGYLALTFGRPSERLAGATGHALEEARHAHQMAASTWSEIYRRHGRLLANETMTPAARLQVSAETNRKSWAAAKKRLQAAMADNADLGAQVHKRITTATAAPASPGAAAIDAEVRAWLRGLDSDARLATLQSARESGDTTILRAVSTAPAPLSGLAPEVHQVYQQTYTELVAPDDAAAAAVYSEAVELLRTASQELDWHVDQLGFDQVKAEDAEDPTAPVHPDFPHAHYPLGEVA